jgi:phosphate transport system permease protein
MSLSIRKPNVPIDVAVNSSGDFDKPTPISEGKTKSYYIDKFYTAIIFSASLVIFLLIVSIAVELFSGSQTSQKAFGLHFFTSEDWDPNDGDGKFGVFPFLVGTLYTSFWALLLAMPISVGTAIFLSEIAPAWIRNPVSYLVELLAAIPSVIYGLWGVFVMCPWIALHIETPISQNKVLSRLPIFDGQPNGTDLMAASLILTIMIIPYITSVSRDILRAIPVSVREGSYALGATKWETISRVVVPYARAGIIGGIMLGLGRALGETMAVTMVIGNNPILTSSLLKPGYTMSSVIANEFPEALGNLYHSALIEVGLTLFFVTMFVNGMARGLVFLTAKEINGGKK